MAWNPAREAELSSVGSDGTVRFWDVRNKGQCVGEVKVGGEGFSMTWRKGGEELVVGRKDDVLVAVDRRMVRETGQWKQVVQTNQISFSNSGRELFLTTGDGKVGILDYPSMVSCAVVQVKGSLLMRTDTAAYAECSHFFMLHCSTRSTRSISGNRWL